MAFLALAAGLVVLALVLKLVLGGKPGKLPEIDVTPVPDAVLNRWPRYANLPRKCLVTGGSGFLGRHLVEALLEQGCEVTVLDIRMTFEDDRVRFVKADLRDAAQVSAALAGQEAVFHTASPDPFTPRTQLLFEVNVGGTENLLAACREHGIRTFVFTSSASVVFSGADQKGVDESTPLPTSFRDAYSKSKAQADQLVLEANGQDGVRTVCVRPHGLFGPRDPQFFPTLIANARAGKGKFKIGDGKNVVDFTYIGNVVHAHLLAASRIETAAGKAYFNTNNAPLPFWDFMGMVLEGFGYPKPSINIPFGLCLALSYVVEFFAKLAGKKAVFTPSKIQIAGTYHYYSTAASAKDLGYEPLWTVEEGLRISLMSFPELRNEAAPLAKSKATGPFTRAEVAKHNSADSLWVVIEDKVYDLTSFDDHPGGDDALLEHAGEDATEGFRGPQHPPTVDDWLPRFYIGDVKE